jgi:hypothetical protein
MMAEMDPVFIKHCGPQKIEAEYQLPRLVGYILHFLADAKAAKSSFLKSKGNLIGSKILGDVSRIVARLIESEGDVETKKVEEASTSFSGFAFDEAADTRNPCLVSIKAATIFNTLPRQRVIRASEPGTNHWHFSIRTAGSRLEPCDAVLLVNLFKDEMRVILTKSLPILSQPDIAAQADMIFSLLLETFPKDITERILATDSNFAPWAWSCNDPALAKAVEDKLKALRVGEGFHTVRIGSEEDNKEANDCWSMIKSKFESGSRA